MKNVLITGGSRGIGAEMVRRFADAGYNVSFTYMASRDAAMSLAESVGANAIYADSAREEDVSAAVECAVKKYGKIDILINNAAVSSFSLLTDLTLDEWNRVMSVSLTGAFLYSRAVLRGMINEQCGRIINISSMWGKVGASCEVHYSAAKAGLIGFTKALAKEVGPSGITVNAIAPGVINTDMNKALDEQTVAQLIEDTPMSRIGTPSDIAAAALFLASDEASFITGEIMNISGGFVV